MRVTRETLIRVAKETAIKQSLSDKGLAAAYLTGSALGDDPFLGGTTDIDLVFIHAESPPVRRQVIGLIPDVHLDIRHTGKDEYRNPKELRTHPQLGPELYNPLWLYENEHFLEFVQAAVRTRFHDPVNVLARARRNIQDARQGWLELQADPADGAQAVLKFLDVIEAAANAVALLNGKPLAERRFLLQFPAVCVAAGQPGFAGRLTALLGTSGTDALRLKEFLPDWEKDLGHAAARQACDPGLSAVRLPYYRGGVNALLEGAMPLAAIWPLLHTWTLAAVSLPAGLQGRYHAFAEGLGLKGQGFAGRVRELDSFIDGIEEMLDQAASSQGIQADTGV